ncbi:MAG: thioredoxin family protein [Melioribacteraceae bacterium]
MKNREAGKLIFLIFLFVSGLTFAQSDPKVTFVELGSVNCIPCKQMQPVMKAIEEKYGEQVKVIFHDVWTDEGKPYASKFGIKLIPTQVFLDDKGKEFFRHEGFYPEKEIDKLLNAKGVKPVNKKR